MGITKKKKLKIKTDGYDIPIIFFQPTLTNPICYCGNPAVHYHYEKSTIIEAIMSEYIKDEDET